MTATVYTFGSASFSALFSGATLVDSAEITELHIPGGSISYIDIGGRMPSRVDLSLYFPIEASYMGLRTSVGKTTSSPLTFPGGSAASAVLVNLQRTYRHTDGATLADGTFVILET